MGRRPLYLGESNFCSGKDRDMRHRTLAKTWTTIAKANNNNNNNNWKDQQGANETQGQQPQQEQPEHQERFADNNNNKNNKNAKDQEQTEDRGRNSDQGQKHMMLGRLGSNKKRQRGAAIAKHVACYDGTLCSKQNF